MPWNLSGQLIETCSCNLICPCWFGVKELQNMDQGWCDGALLFRIQEGSSDGVALGGRTVALAMDLPGPTMFDGNGTLRLYIDDGATPQQMQELEGILTGARGGPTERLASIISNVLPSQRVAIRVQEDGDSLTATVGDFGQIQANPLTSETGKPVIIENAGPMRLDKVQVAPSASRWSDPDLPRRFETKSGGVGNFVWSGS